MFLIFKVCGNFNNIKEKKTRCFKWNINDLRGGGLDVHREIASYFTESTHTFYGKYIHSNKLIWNLNSMLIFGKFNFQFAVSVTFFFNC